MVVFLPGNSTCSLSSAQHEGQHQPVQRGISTLQHRSRLRGCAAARGGGGGVSRPGAAPAAFFCERPTKQDLPLVLRVLQVVFLDVCPQPLDHLQQGGGGGTGIGGRGQKQGLAGVVRGAAGCHLLHATRRGAAQGGLHGRPAPTCVRGRRSSPRNSCISGDRYEPRLLPEPPALRLRAPPLLRGGQGRAEDGLGCTAGRGQQAESSEQRRATAGPPCGTRTPRPAAPPHSRRCMLLLFLLLLLLLFLLLFLLLRLHHTTQEASGASGRGRHVARLRRRGSTVNACSTAPCAAAAAAAATVQHSTAG